MKIAVTGATGFVGRALVAALAAGGHDVVAAARHAPQPAFEGRVRFVAFDMMKDDPVAALGVPDVLAHLAWPGLPNYRDRFHIDENLPASEALIEAMVGAGVRQVLVTGTCFEYGMQEGCLSEDAPAQPSNPYGQAKDDLRRRLEALAARRPFILQWARLFYMHGPGQGQKSLLSQLDRALDRGDEYFDMSGGEQVRDYLPVAEAARLLARLIESRVPGIYNVCSGEPVTVRALVERHIAARGKSIKLNLGHYPYPDYEPMRFWGDATKLKKVTG
jgi:dTDP-6-deoxy-L-talose 4-dehydrogenase (NAD+)